MPYLHIRTNQTLSEESQAALVDAASSTLSAAMGKREAVFMVSLDISVTMRFGGSSEPAALAHLSALGIENQDTNALTKVICDLVSSGCEVPSPRIFVQFEGKARDMWGCDGKTFA